MQKFIKFHKKSKKKIEWSPAPDVKKRVFILLKNLSLKWSKKPRIFCFRSENANTRAYARIWGLSRIWQKALKAPPSYIIEVVSERFDNLPDFEKDKVLLHEIAHIPNNFSGALVPHIRRGKRNFRDKVRRHLLDYLRAKK